jgi:hypothetical protein
MTGHLFYNVNSTFYVWYDSWEEAEAGTKAHGDRVGWPNMPAAAIPTMGRYLKEHTTAQIVDRVADGAKEVMQGVIRSYGYFDYILLYGGLLLTATVVRWPRARQLAKENAILLAFFVLYFTLYVLLYFWYAPIASGDRLTLALFIPLLLVLATGLDAVLRGDQVRIGGRSISWLAIVHVTPACSRRDSLSSRYISGG